MTMWKAAQITRIRPTYLVVLLLLLVINSCTSTRWVMQEKQAIDPEDYELISQKPQLVQQGTVTPDNPVVSLAVYNRNTYRYKEKVLMERYIQEYRPRWTYTVLSLTGAGLLFYTSHSDLLVDNASRSETVMFNVTGGLLALSSLMNMEPTGNPIKTGETQFRRTTGNQEIVKAEKAHAEQIGQVEFSLVHKEDSLVKRQQINVEDSVVNLNLVELIDPQRFSTFKPDTVQLNVYFQDQAYEYKIAKSDFLTPFVQVTSAISELRNAPDQDQENILTDLARNSMLELVESVQEDWYKVKFGIKNTYIDKKEVQIVWRPRSFEQQESIVTLPNVPFGDIDVESNVPVLVSENARGIGLLVANENYSNQLPVRKYAQRDARLIELYLTQSLGYKENNIFNAYNIGSVNTIFQTLGKVEERIKPDTTDLMVFLSGHVIVREQEGEYNYYMVPVNMKNPESVSVRELLNLKDFFHELSKLPTRQIIVWSDFDFHNKDQMLKEYDNIKIIRPLATIARNLTEYHSRSAVGFSSQFNQPSRVYFKKETYDKKHRIYPYYLAHGIQRRMTNLEDLQDFLERNVTYTARKLYDQPQNPQLFGNRNISLLPVISP